jgi:hypothetical protein
MHLKLMGEDTRWIALPQDCAQQKGFGGNFIEPASSVAIYVGYPESNLRFA